MPGRSVGWETEKVCKREENRRLIGGDLLPEKKRVRRRGTPAPYSIWMDLLQEERVEVGARVGRLEEITAGPLRDELTLVPVVVRSPRRVLRRNLHVEVAVGLVARVAGKLVGGDELLVHLRVVEVREVVVVRVVDV